jgi:hypothetical protein
MGSQRTPCARPPLQPLAELRLLQNQCSVCAMPSYIWSLAIISACTFMVAPPPSPSGPYLSLQQEISGVPPQKYFAHTCRIEFSQILNTNHCEVVPQETPVQTKVLPDYQTNPLRQHTPTWEKFNHIGGHMGHKWDCGTDWLEDYTYYAEIIGDNDEDWWGAGMTEPSDGDADIPQPKVFRSWSKSSATMLDFVKCGLQRTCSGSECHCRKCRVMENMLATGQPCCCEIHE